MQTNEIEVAASDITEATTVEEAEQILLEWKEAYGYIYLTEFSGETFIYRLLTFKEYEALSEAAVDKLELDEMICERVVLDPYVDWREEIFAGYTATLAGTILEQSLLVTGKDPELDATYILGRLEEEIDGSFLKQLPLIIKHCFQEYTLKEIEALALPEQLELYSRARWMLKNLENINLEFESE